MDFNVKCCGNCSCNYSEIFDGMVLRHYCNNHFSDNYMADISYVGWCKYWDEPRIIYKGTSTDNCKKDILYR